MPESKRKKSPFLLKIILIPIFLLALFSVSVLLFLNAPPYSSDSSSKNFSVRKGESIAVIGELLKQENLIRSPLFLRGLHHFFYSEVSFKAGRYAIPPGRSTNGIIRLLAVPPPPVLITLTFPEGWTIRQMARYVGRKTSVKPEEFRAAAEDTDLLKAYGLDSSRIKTLEGFLFPDTYKVNQEGSARDLVKMMVETTFRKLRALLNDKQANQGSSDAFTRAAADGTLQEKMILASIVEKEYKVKEEAPRIAAVFRNRLKINMRLQSCATIIYVITEEYGKKHPERIFFKDLEIPSAYNTYRQYGLPPGPISNPGLTALKAAFYPSDEDNLFFVVKDISKGTHTFTKTLKDHEKARELYLRSFWK